MGYARAYVRAIRTLLKSRRWDFTKTEKEKKEKESQGHTLCSRLDNTFSILTITVCTLANLMCGKTSISVSDTFNRAFTSLINTEALDSDSILREEGHTAGDNLYANSMLAFALRSKVSHKLIDNVRHWKRECSGKGCYDAFHSCGMMYPISEIQYINLSGICVHDLIIAPEEVECLTSELHGVVLHQEHDESCELPRRQDKLLSPCGVLQ